MNKSVFFLTSILLALILPNAILFADDFYYNSTSEGITTEEIWNINFSDEGFSLYAGGPDKQVEMDGQSNSNGEGIRISYRVPAENNRFITAEKDDNRLILTGVDKNGKKINKNVRINAPWFSNFYIMPQFIKSDEEKIDFCILEPLRSSVIKLRAAKELEETLIVDGKQIETVKVCITIPGLIAAVWHSNIWYRKSDGVFVKTEETRGFPGTPRTYMIMKN
jgi:hypothetical protein